MLTAQEREWLERRKSVCTYCAKRTSCKRGEKYNFRKEECKYHAYSFLRDAHILDIEFEARVAARLAELVNSEPWPNLWPECISCERHAKEGDAACPPCVLKEARLAVEAEMKKEKKSCK